jgi:hypothetical protein
MRLAADHDRRAIPACDIEIGTDLFQMALVNKRPDLGRGIEGMADFQRLYARGEFFDEFFRDARLNQ